MGQTVVLHIVVERQGAAGDWAFVARTGAVAASHAAGRAPGQQVNLACIAAGKQPPLAGIAGVPERSGMHWHMPSCLHFIHR